MKIHRRKFVFSLAALAVAPPERLFGRTLPKVPEEVRPLNEPEKKVLGFLCDQIVPRDEFSGASDLGVVDFIDRLLREAHPGWTEIYRSGILATDASSQRLHERTFAELEFEMQTALLQKMEKGELSAEDWESTPQQEFFEMLRSHTLAGTYSHPKWGGNRAKKAWEMIGYDDFWT